MYYCPTIFSWSYSSFCLMIFLVAPLSHLSPVLCAGSLTQARESPYKPSTCQLDIAMLDGCIQKSARVLRAEQFTTSLLVSCPHVGWSIHILVFMRCIGTPQEGKQYRLGSGKPRELWHWKGTLAQRRVLIMKSVLNFTQTEVKHPV